MKIERRPPLTDKCGHTKDVEREAGVVVSPPLPTPPESSGKEIPVDKEDNPWMNTTH